MNRIAVVHLVRAGNGPSALCQFLESYGANPGGIDHDLVVVLKGFENGVTPSNFPSMLAGVEHRVLHVSDDGFDLTAYQKALMAFPDFDYYCFLNSFSCLVDPDWLAKLHGQAARQDVGVTGATGSWQSLFSDLRRGMSHSLKKVASGEELARVPWQKRITATSIRVYNLAQYGLTFKPFPNYHVRTNGFMLSKRSLGLIRWRQVLSKHDGYRFESGRDSLTQQLLRRGLRAVVVGRDGVGYGTDRWIASNTFWQADQANLLIEDNQTREYRDGGQQTKSELSLYAWGIDLTQGPVDSSTERT